MSSVVKAAAAKPAFSSGDGISSTSTSSTTTSRAFDNFITTPPEIRYPRPPQRDTAYSSQAWLQVPPATHSRQVRTHLPSLPPLHLPQHDDFSSNRIRPRACSMTFKIYQAQQSDFHSQSRIRIHEGCVWSLIRERTVRSGVHVGTRKATVAQTCSRGQTLPLPTMSDLLTAQTTWQ